MMRLFGALVSLVALGAVVACGDDDDDDGTATGGTAPGGATTGGAATGGAATGGDAPGGAASGGAATGGAAPGGAAPGGAAPGGAAPGGAAPGGTSPGGAAPGGAAPGGAAPGGAAGGTLGGAGGSPMNAPRDVTVAMTNMTPHVDQQMEFRVVDGSNNLVFRGLLENLPTSTYDYDIPRSTPEGVHRVDFYADLNGNGAYNAPPTDHAWTRPISASGDDVVSFSHDTTFDDIDDPAVTPLGEDFVLSLLGMAPHVSQLFELRVVRVPNERLVGRYVLGAVPGATFDLTIPGIIEDGVEYRVDFYADFDGSGAYDPPPTDHAWRRTGTGTASGLTVNFTHDTTFTDVGFQ